MSAWGSAFRPEILPTRSPRPPLKFMSPWGTSQPWIRILRRSHGKADGASFGRQSRVVTFPCARPHGWGSRLLAAAAGGRPRSRGPTGPVRQDAGAVAGPGRAVAGAALGSDLPPRSGSQAASGRGAGRGRRRKAALACSAAARASGPSPGGCSRGARRRLLPARPRCPGWSARDGAPRTAGSGAPTAAARCGASESVCEFRFYTSSTPVRFLL